MSKIYGTFRTEKNTELPLLDLRGKPYLQVAHRLVWYRERYPMGVIKTQMLERGGEGQDEYAVFRAEIYADSEKGPQLLATAHKRESRRDFPDFIEKSETSAVGRALAMIGIGTQFVADELDEGDRLADAPVSGMTKSTAPAVNEPAKKSSFRKKIEITAATNSSNDL